jgi:glucokinase
MVAGTTLRVRRVAEIDTPTLAVDLGGTQMRAAIVAADGEVLLRRAMPTPQDAHCPDALMELTGDVLAHDDVTHAVIGLPGRVNYRHGRLEHAPNLPAHWVAALEEQQLSGRFDVEVSLANDADLAAVGEAYFGGGRGYADVAYLTISTGVGAGVLLGHRLVAGARSLAEIGHTVIEHMAARQGEPGSLEDLGSGTALGRRAAVVGAPTDGRRIVELVHAGDAAAVAVWQQTCDVISTGVANLAYLFSPQVIVLGGGVGRNDDLLRPEIQRRLVDAGPPSFEPPIAIVAAQLGDDAGLVGAAGWRRATREPCHG